MLQVVCHEFLFGAAGEFEFRLDLDIDLDRIEVAVAAQFDDIVRRQFGLLEDQFLDLRREDVHAANDQHVVGTAGDLADAAEGARRRGEQAGQVAGSLQAVVSVTVGVVTQLLGVIRRHITRRDSVHINAMLRPFIGQQAGDTALRLRGELAAQGAQFAELVAVGPGLIRVVLTLELLKAKRCCKPST